jgi:hypothetical protein
MTIGAVAAIAGVASAGVGIASAAGAFKPDPPKPQPYTPAPTMQPGAQGAPVPISQAEAITGSISDFFRGAADLVTAARAPDAALVLRSQPVLNVNRDGLQIPQSILLQTRNGQIVSVPAPAAAPVQTAGFSLKSLENIDPKTAAAIGVGIVVLAVIASR